MQMVIRRKQKWLYSKQTKQTLKQKDKELHYILMKDLIQQETDITTINIYAHNDRMNIYEAKTDRIKKKNKQFYYNSWGF